MKVRITPQMLRGTVTPPASKSLLHRELICQALAGEWNEALEGGADVRHTAAGLRQLWQERAPVIHCGDSGSTLRFLLPLAMARGQVDTVFTGSRRLMERPVPGDWGLLRTDTGLQVTRQLTGGRYRLPGQQTSQLVSGMLMALPLCREDSIVELTEPLVSRPYVDMTLGVLDRHGIRIEEADEGWRIPGGQRFVPKPWQREGDWSAAAWFHVLRALGCRIDVAGLRADSLQGDRRVMDYCQNLPQCVDVSQTPDLLMPLALLAALQPGRVTRFTGAAFLRRKESDRLESTAATLNALGAQVREETDGLTVAGVEGLRGGAVDSCGDHRIAMLAACAAVFCEKPVELTGAENVDKSYPAFWLDYRQLHGQVEVLAP